MSDESTVNFPHKLVKQFILMYKDFECLWNRDCSAYKVKMKRHQAITQLTQLAQTYDPAATRVHVLRKIDSLRACVRREHKKVTDSRLVAKNEDEIYSPKLWYYPLFSFLIQQEEMAAVKQKQPAKAEPEPNSPEPNAECSEEEEVEETSEDPIADNIKAEPAYQEICIEPMEGCIYTPGTSKRKSVSEEPRRKRTKPRGSDGPSGADDEYDAIGINVAAKLRYLPENMRILAEKLISDVLFQAQTNGLTSATVLVTPDPFF